MEKPLSLDYIRQVVSDYFADKPVLRVEIFGSYARGEATAESDVDLLLTMMHPVGWHFMQYAEDLSQRLGVRVDAGTALSDYMMRYVRRDLIVLYEAQQVAAA